MTARIWTPGSGAALPVAPNTILNPNVVKGYVAHDERTPSRLFYVLWLEDDSVWEVDGYRVGPPEAPDDADVVKWSLNLYCPKCKQNIRLDSTRKPFKVHQGLGLETGEPIQCPWPAEFGGLCSFRAELELPRKGEDRIVTIPPGRKVKIDAVAKRA